MRRGEWEFQVAAATVAQAAGSRAEHHRGREKFWRGELDRAQEDLRQAGTHFREHAVTGGRQVNVVIDQEKQNHVNHCASKADEHEKKAGDYEAFQRACHLAADRTLLLHVDDVRFFGL